MYAVSQASIHSQHLHQDYVGPALPPGVAVQISLGHASPPSIGCSWDGTNICVASWRNGFCQQREDGQNQGCQNSCFWWRCWFRRSPRGLRRTAPIPLSQQPEQTAEFRDLPRLLQHYQFREIYYHHILRQCLSAVSQVITHKSLLPTDNVVSRKEKLKLEYWKG